MKLLSWLYDIFLNNKIAKNEMRVFYGWEPDESH